MDLKRIEKFSAIRMYEKTYMWRLCSYTLFKERVCDDPGLSMALLSLIRLISDLPEHLSRWDRVGKSKVKL